MRAELSPNQRTSLRQSGKILTALLFLTLPLVNPWVRGDGVGYYAYVRSLLVEHKLDFQNDWRAANQSFTMGRILDDGEIAQTQYTPTGHLDNHFAVGPSMLWAPFLVPVHFVMRALQSSGVPVRADGFSRPYIVAMALATALYGFLGLWLSFLLACRYVEPRWALLATLSFWFASSLPVYMYFNPSWSHAHSVFVVALFLWYWNRTRPERTAQQWAILGLISGLMLDVYYANIALLLVPLLESLGLYWRAWRTTTHNWHQTRRLLIANLLCFAATLIAFSPTLITRQIIYGHPLELGYGGMTPWNLCSPYCGSVLFSSDHGLLVWTPIVIPALLGLALFLKRGDCMAQYLIAACFGFYYVIAISPWNGSAFGNRRFLSLTPVFILGLAFTFSEFARVTNASRLGLVLARSVAAALIVWNLAFIFQWGTHLVPARGPISWKQMVHNQFFVVPQRAAGGVKAYFQDRRGLMHQIEQQDVSQLNGQAESGKETSKQK